MALQNLNLLHINMPDGGSIDCELEYDDVSLAVTRLLGSNTSGHNYMVQVTNTQNGQSRTVTLTAHSSPSVNVPNGWASVTIVPGDVLPPIQVVGVGT